MPVADRHTSTAYSAERYAPSFFLPATPAARQPYNGHARMTDWSKLNLGPVYSSSGDRTMKLADIVGKQGSDEIKALGEIRFHALGDSGVNHAEQAENVAEEMAGDYQAGAGGLNPAFLFHLGDVVYVPTRRTTTGSASIGPTAITRAKFWLFPVTTTEKPRARPMNLPSPLSQSFLCQESTSSPSGLGQWHLS